jgi:hypothetical protein
MCLEFMICKFKGDREGCLCIIFYLVNNKLERVWKEVVMA